MDKIVPFSTLVVFVLFGQTISGINTRSLLWRRNIRGRPSISPFCFCLPTFQVLGLPLLLLSFLDQCLFVCLYGVFTLHGTSGHSATGPTALRDFRTTSRVNFCHQKCTSLTPQWKDQCLKYEYRHTHGL